MPALYLPDELGDLFREHVGADSFVSLKETRVELYDLPWLDRWNPDIIEHIKRERENFKGLPEICHYHAALIIRIRRNFSSERDFEAFKFLWESEWSFLVQNLSSRWIVSALDTFADLGSFEQKAFALAIVGFMNGLKLAETEYTLCGKPEYVSSCVEENFRTYPHLWDGRRAFHFGGDDTVANTLMRIRAFVKVSAMFDKILFKLLDEALKGGTLLERFRKAHDANLNLYLERIYPEFGVK